MPLFPSIRLETCDGPVSSIHTTIELQTNYIGKGCDRETYSEKSLQKLCGMDMAFSWYNSNIFPEKAPVPRDLYSCNRWIWGQPFVQRYLRHMKEISWWRKVSWLFRFTAFLVAWSKRHKCILKGRLNTWGHCCVFVTLKSYRSQSNGHTLSHFIFCLLRSPVSHSSLKSCPLRVLIWTSDGVEHWSSTAPECLFNWVLFWSALMYGLHLLWQTHSSVAHVLISIRTPLRNYFVNESFQPQLLNY